MKTSVRGSKFIQRTDGRSIDMTMALRGIDPGPFRPDGTPQQFISYRSQREACSFIRETMKYEHGCGLISGPAHAGKTTAIRQFIKQLPEDAAATIVDGANLQAPEFLEAITKGYGFELGSSSLNVMLNFLKVFAVQQATSNQAPLLVIENLHAMTPGTVHIVCQLAQLMANDRSAFCFILVSEHPLDKMISAPGLRSLKSRKSGECKFSPMTRAEAAYYIDAKLRTAGVDDPATVLSPDGVDELYDESGGYPGRLDACVIERAMRFEENDQELPDLEAVRFPFEVVEETAWDPDDVVAPHLIITQDGKTIGTVELNQRRTMIGRSDYNDVAIDSTFISRHHAMLVRDGGKTVLTDLNSTNGTFVNSQRVFTHGLRHDDVISLGNHGIKLCDPGCRERAEVAEPDLADTAKMKALTDVRRKCARENLNLHQERSSA